MQKLEKVIKALECCLVPGVRKCKECPYEKACYHDSLCDITMHNALELLKEQQGISVDSFLKWCIESHIMGDATRNGIEYWVNEFKAWKQKAKDGEQVDERNS